MPQLNFVALAGRAGPASELLRVIVERYQQRTVDRDGQRWTPVRRIELMEAVCLTPKQFRGAVTKLKAKRLVLFRMAMHEGCKMPFFALGAQVQGALFGTLEEAEEPVPTEQGALLGTPYAGACAGASFNILSSNTSKIEDNSNTIGGLTPTDPGDVVVSKFSGKASVLDIAAALKAKGAIKAEMSKPLPLGHVWRDAVVRHQKIYAVSPGPAEIAMLKQAASKCPEGTAARVIDHAIEHWSSFLVKAKTDEAAFPLPSKPAVGFFRKHIQAAINLYLDALKFTQPAPQPKPFQPTENVQAPPKPAPKPEDVKMTKEELLKIMENG